MKVAVTGGAGFIGSHVADAFFAAGHEVVVLDNFYTGKRDNVSSGIRVYDIDITTSDLDNIFDREQFDIVSHHAAHMELRVSVEKPVFDAEQNVLGSLRILEASRRTNVKHVVLASTGGGLYGEQDVVPAPETHPIRPTSPYGTAKRSMELYADYYRRVHGLATTCLRYTNVYGPRQNPFGEAGVIAIFLEKWLTGTVPVVYGDGSQLRDYVHVGDVSKANLAAVETSTVGEYNISTGRGTSLLTVIDIMREHLQCDTPISFGPAKVGDISESVATSEAFQRATSWRAEVPVENGIASTVEWFVSRHLA